MKLIGIMSTAVLSLILGAAAPAYAQQEEHAQQDEKKAQQDKPAQQEEKNAQQDEKKAQQDKPAQQQEKHAQQDEKKAQQDKPAQQQEKHAQQDEKKAQQDKPAQEQEKHAQQDEKKAQQQRGTEQPQRTQEQQHVQQTAWQQHSSQHWDSDHRTWQQRGGYHGYRIPDDRFRGYFGPEHGFRIYGLPFLVVGGYPRFQYGGYWVSTVDPWPQYWAADWYDTDDVYVVYVDNGYYLYNRRYPNVGIAISISL
jgi:hypothetical protein